MRAPYKNRSGTSAHDRTHRSTRAPTRVHSITTRITTGHGYTAALARAGVPRGCGSATTNAQPNRPPGPPRGPPLNRQRDPHRHQNPVSITAKPRHPRAALRAGDSSDVVVQDHLPLKPRASGHAPSHGGPAVTDHPTGQPRTRARTRRPAGRLGRAAKSTRVRDVGVAHHPVLPACHPGPSNCRRPLGRRGQGQRSRPSGCGPAVVVEHRI